MFESFNAARRSLGECFNRSVRTVAYVPYNLMSRGCSLRKEPVPDSLNFALYQKLSCYSHARKLFTLNQLAWFPLLQCERLVI